MSDVTRRDALKIIATTAATRGSFVEREIGDQEGFEAAVLAELRAIQQWTNGDYRRWVAEVSIALGIAHTHRLPYSAEGLQWTAEVRVRARGK